MPKFTKRHKANLDMLPAEPVSVEEAVKILKSFKAPKFDQAVNVVAQALHPLEELITAQQRHDAI